MKQAKRMWIVWASLALLLVVVLAACGSTGGEATPEGLDGAALVQERCSECHDLSRVTSARQTRAAWQATVESMIQRGARLSEAEAVAVIDHLAETYPE